MMLKYLSLILFSTLTVYSFSSAILNRGPSYSRQNQEGKDLLIVKEAGKSLTVGLPMRAEQDVRLIIMDVLGRAVKDTLYQKLQVPGELSLDVSRLKQGLYFIRVYYSRYIWNKKIIYQPAD